MPKEKEKKQRKRKPPAGKGKRSAGGPATFLLTPPPVVTTPSGVRFPSLDLGKVKGTSTTPPTMGSMAPRTPEKSQSQTQARPRTPKTPRTTDREKLLRTMGLSITKKHTFYNLIYALDQWLNKNAAFSQLKDERALLASMLPHLKPPAEMFSAETYTLDTDAKSEGALKLAHGELIAEQRQGIIQLEAMLAIVNVLSDVPGNEPLKQLHELLEKLCQQYQLHIQQLADALRNANHEQLQTLSQRTATVFIPNQGFFELDLAQASQITGINPDGSLGEKANEYGISFCSYRDGVFYKRLSNHAIKVYEDERKKSAGGIHPGVEISHTDSSISTQYAILALNAHTMRVNGVTATLPIMVMQPYKDESLIIPIQVSLAAGKKLDQAQIYQNEYYDLHHSVLNLVNTLLEHDDALANFRDDLRAVFTEALNDISFFTNMVNFSEEEIATALVGNARLKEIAYIFNTAASQIPEFDGWVELPKPTLGEEPYYGQLAQAIDDKELTLTELHRTALLISKYPRLAANCSIIDVCLFTRYLQFITELYHKENKRNDAFRLADHIAELADELCDITTKTLAKTTAHIEDDPEFSESESHASIFESTGDTTTVESATTHEAVGLEYLRNSDHSMAQALSDAITCAMDGHTKNRALGVTIDKKSKLPQFTDISFDDEAISPVSMELCDTSGVYFIKLLSSALLAADSRALTNYLTLKFTTVSPEQALLETVCDVAELTDACQHMKIFKTANTDFLSAAGVDNPLSLQTLNMWLERLRLVSAFIRNYVETHSDSPNIQEIFAALEPEVARIYANHRNQFPNPNNGFYKLRTKFIPASQIENPPETSASNKTEKTTSFDETVQLFINKIFADLAQQKALTQQAAQATASSSTEQLDKHLLPQDEPFASKIYLLLNSIADRLPNISKIDNIETLLTPQLLTQSIMNGNVALTQLLLNSGVLATVKQKKAHKIYYQHAIALSSDKTKNNAYEILRLLQSAGANPGKTPLLEQIIAANKYSLFRKFVETDIRDKIVFVKLDRVADFIVRHASKPGMTRCMLRLMHADPKLSIALANRRNLPKILLAHYPRLYTQSQQLRLTEKDSVKALRDSCFYFTECIDNQLGKNTTLAEQDIYLLKLCKWLSYDLIMQLNMKLPTTEIVIPQFRNKSNQTINVALKELYRNITKYLIKSKSDAEKSKSYAKPYLSLATEQLAKVEISRRLPQTARLMRSSSSQSVHRTRSSSATSSGIVLKRLGGQLQRQNTSPRISRHSGSTGSLFSADIALSLTAAKNKLVNDDCELFIYQAENIFSHGTDFAISPQLTATLKQQAQRGLVVIFGNNEISDLVDYLHSQGVPICKALCLNKQDASRTWRRHYTMLKTQRIAESDATSAKQIRISHSSKPTPSPHSEVPAADTPTTTVAQTQTPAATSRLDHWALSWLKVFTPSFWRNISWRDIFGITPKTRTPTPVHPSAEHAVTTSSRPAAAAIRRNSSRALSELDDPTTLLFSRGNLRMEFLRETLEIGEELNPSTICISLFKIFHKLGITTDQLPALKRQTTVVSSSRQELTGLQATFACGTIAADTNRWKNRLVEELQIIQNILDAYCPSMASQTIAPPENIRPQVEEAIAYAPQRMQTRFTNLLTLIDTCKDSDNALDFYQHYHEIQVYVARLIAAVQRTPTNTFYRQLPYAAPITPVSTASTSRVDDRRRHTAPPTSSLRRTGTPHSSRFYQAGPRRHTSHDERSIDSEQVKTTRSVNKHINKWQRQSHLSTSLSALPIIPGVTG